MQQFEQDRRADVVGKIADHANRLRLVTQDVSEIHIEEIGLNDVDVGKLRREGGSEIAIEFDRDDLPDATLSRLELLGNAPDSALEAGLFKVPRVIG